MDVTPLAEFGTMGLDDYQVDLEEWRLVVDGKVEKPLSLKYSEILDLPSIEKTVLLVCPGVFVNNGTWKGISILELLKRAQVKDDAAYVTLRGPRGNYEKVERYPLNDAGSDLALSGISGQRHDTSAKARLSFATCCRRSLWQRMGKVRMECESGLMNWLTFGMA